jgi:DNA-binding beta-propeller fold protein YncE/cytochrome c peroxidase
MLNPNLCRLVLIVVTGVATVIACTTTDSGRDKSPPDGTHKGLTSRDSALDPACQPALNTNIGGAIVRQPDLDESAALAYRVSLDANDPRIWKPVNVRLGDPDADAHEQQPQLGIAEISSAMDGVTLQIGIKRPSQRPDLIWLELLLINDSPTGFKNLVLSINNLPDDLVIYDLATDLWADAPGLSEPPGSPELLVGNIAPEGVTRFILGIGTADKSTLSGHRAAPLDIELALSGTRSRRSASTSQRIMLTPDGDEVWAPYADGNLIAVVDTARAKTVATINVAGAPQGMAITPDGRFALTVAPLCNQLVVIDREQRKVVQRFGEAEGIGREPREIAISPDGARVFIGSYVGNTVAAFERRESGFTHVATADVGRRPTAMSVSPDSRALFVAHLLPRGPLAENETWVSVHATNDLSLLTDQARILDGGNPAVVGCLRELGGFYERWQPEQLQMESPFTLLQGAFLNPGGTDLLVPGSVTVPFLIFEGDMRAAGLDARLGRITTANILPFDARVPERTHVKQLDTLFEIPDRGQVYQQCANRNANVEFANRYKHEPNRPDIWTYDGETMPTGENGLFQTGHVRSVAYTRGGRRTILVAYTSDELVVIDGATRHPVSRAHLVLSGSNPLGLAQSPDGSTAYVLYDNSPFISVIDLSSYAIEGELPRPAYVPFWQSRELDPRGNASLVSVAHTTRDVSAVPELPPIKEIGQIALVDDDPMDPRIRRGKILFSSANPDKYPELSAHREGSCNHCHAGGGMDGSAWATIEGERRTPSLRGGVGSRGWLHAQATHPDAYEFVTTVSVQRFGGTGLSDSDADAMANYVAWHIPRLQAPVTDPALVVQGKALFEENCSECHLDGQGQSGPTASRPYGGGEENLHDVGTRSHYAGAAMGEAFQQLFSMDPVRGPVLAAVVGDRAFTADDIVFTSLKSAPRPERAAGKFEPPSLVNAWDNALYFHDARYTELRQAVRYMADENYIPLTDVEVDAVVEYLRTL